MPEEPDPNLEALRQIQEDGSKVGHWGAGLEEPLRGRNVHEQSAAGHKGLKSCPPHHGDQSSKHGNYYTQLGGKKLPSRRQ